MSKSTTTTLVISIGLFVVSVAGLAIMVYQVNEQGKQLASQVATLEAERAQEDSYYKLQRLSEETQLDREELGSYFLERESNSIDLLNLVESLAPKAGVSLKTEKLDVLADKGDGLKWIEASFSFASTRENVQNFIQVLETLPYVLRLTETEMNIMSETVWQAKVTIQVQILAYDE